ncbi:hypothetical protein OUZ56_029639 [Daphnia magna]|uniref:Uncharacterized protein n=1 Tax=Daphnia magna TaxID=35525 RepID=A0ABR0B7E7_9CRUS|nr:hypothetical protein OUZ56_029639 [Daphnia magna]
MEGLDCVKYIIQSVWYPINMTTRYFVPSLFLFPVMDMVLATVCTEMGKANSMKHLGICSILDRDFSRSFLRASMKGFDADCSNGPGIDPCSPSSWAISHQRKLGVIHTPNEGDNDDEFFTSSYWILIDRHLHRLIAVHDERIEIVHPFFLALK